VGELGRSAALTLGEYCAPREGIACIGVPSLTSSSSWSEIAEVRSASISNIYRLQSVVAPKLGTKGCLLTVSMSPPEPAKPSKIAGNGSERVYGKRQVNILKRFSERGRLSKARSVTTEIVS
jgi:hypothetical protein